ncbi:MAG: type II secretion system F family protein [Solirubrobacterales bacterium]
MTGAVELATAAAAVSASSGALAACLAVDGLRGRSASIRDGRVVALRRLLGHVPRAVPRMVDAAGRRDFAALLAAAGLDDALRPREIAAARVLLVALAALAVPRLAGALPARMLPLVVPLWLLGAAELPLWWLRRRAARRTAALLATLPDALDLLRACLAAGLPLRRSLWLVGAHCREPVAGELNRVAVETAFGVTRDDALERLQRRNPAPAIRSLVAAFRQAERHGSPLAPVVAAQAAEARAALNRAIVERGARAGPKIQLVVSTTIVPGAMLGIAAAVIAAIARGDIRFL